MCWRVEMARGWSVVEVDRSEVSWGGVGPAWTLANTYLDD